MNLEYHDRRQSPSPAPRQRVDTIKRDRYTLKTLWLFLTPMGLNSNPEPGQKST